MRRPVWILGGNPCSAPHEGATRPGSIAPILSADPCRRMGRSWAAQREAQQHEARAAAPDLAEDAEFARFWEAAGRVTLD